MNSVFAARQQLSILGCLSLALLLTGCIDPRMMKKGSEEKAKEPAPPAAAAAPAAAPAAPPSPAFPQDNTKLVDKKQILAENPKLVEVQNRINASDPVSAAAQGYFAIGSQAQLLNLKHAIDLHKAEHEKPPAFAEFDQMLRQNNIPLKGILRWQVYAYDDSTGELCILEDREYKKSEYEKAGLKYQE